jgi:4-oxalocrotonate tautomerase
MPHVNVKMYPGRSQAQKQSLSEEMVAAIKRVLGSADHSISVVIEDVSPEAWGETVITPEIDGKPDKVFKKPG